MKRPPARSLFTPGDDAPLLETVSQLTERIKYTLETQFQSVFITAEVSGVSRPHSGHLYFSLKDEFATIRGVMWKSTAERLPIVLEDGLRVRCAGKLSVYAPRGEYQLVVSRIELDGLGRLDQILRERRERLAAEGLFARERKRALPAYPCRVVLVTSPTGAAVRDVLQVMGRRWPLAEVWIAPARVQGVGADEEVIRALELANRAAGVDLVMVVRGGGSLEDLWTFNEENVVWAIAASRLPVITGIGHEIDVTLADLAADRRALTPSEAAEIVAPDRNEVGQRLDDLEERLSRLLLDRLRGVRQRMDRLREAMRIRLMALAVDRRSRLERLGDGLGSAMRGTMQARRSRLELEGRGLGPALAARLRAFRGVLERTEIPLQPLVVGLVRQRRLALERLATGLEALAPARVLNRGYSLTVRERDGAQVRSPADVSAGERIVTLLVAGRITSAVEPPQDSPQT